MLDPGSRTKLHISQPLSGTAELGVKTRLLQAERARRLWRLHFRRGLEREFRDYVAHSSRGMRTGILLFTAVFLLLTPWFGGYFLSDAPILSNQLPPLVYAQLPVIFAVTLLIWLRPSSRHASWLCLLICMMGIGVTLVLRDIAASHGYDIPLEYTGVYITGLLIILRTPFWQALPWVMLATAAVIANECLVVQPPLPGYFHLIATLTLIGVSCAGGFSHEYFIRQTWLNNYLLSLLSSRDGMTGLLNRAALQTATHHMIAHAHRQQSAFAVAMVDIDYFKQYNDSYGHTAGDAVIYRIASLLRDAARRPHDFCGRFGGEEFILAWTEGNYEDLRQLADDLRERIEQAAIPHEASPISDHVTISAGLYWVAASDIKLLFEKPDQPTIGEIEHLFDAADKLLYQAKNAGRNRVASKHEMHTAPVEIPDCVAERVGYRI